MARMRTGNEWATALALRIACACALANYLAMAAEEFDPAFYANPGAWEGICASGRMQSPINLPGEYDQLPSVRPDLVTKVRMPVVHEPIIINEGHAVKVRLFFSSRIGIVCIVLYRMLYRLS